jgi:predicted enzyme related to lactoylglutathione lyase
MIKEIAFVGYPTTNMKRAREFYEGILGLVPTSEFGEVTDTSEFAEYAVGSGTFSLGCMEQWKPSKDGPSVAFEVENYEEAIKKLKDNNVVFNMETMDTPSCHMAIVQDPDGNAVLIHKRKNG